MQPRAKPALAAAAAAFLLAACQGQPLREANVDLTPAGGTLAGAAAGASAVTLLGTVGTLGTVLATVAGGLLGDNLLDTEKLEQGMARNETVTLEPRPVGRAQIRPLTAYERDGRMCRDFVVSAQQAGAPIDTRRVSACVVGENRWQVVRVF